VKFVPLNPHQHWQWVEENIEATWCADTKGIVAVDDHGEIAAALVFDSWTYTSVVCHFAIPNPMAIRRGLFTEGYNYIFETSGRRIMLGITPTDRVKALKLLKHMGWEEVYRLPDGFAEGIDLVYSRFTKEQWLSKRAA
jgi:hypothetical protein